MSTQYVVNFTLEIWERFEEWVQPGPLDNGYFLFTELVEFFEALAVCGDVEMTQTDYSIILVMRGMRNLLEQRLRTKGYVRNNPEKDYGKPLGGYATKEDVIHALAWEVANSDMTIVDETPAQEAGDMLIMLRVLARGLGINIDDIASEKLEAMHQKRKSRNGPMRKYLGG